MSAFPIVPRAGGARVGSSAPAGSSFAMPTLDLGKISFASMGGSAAPVVLPENDDPYDVDSSDEDLDGMEAAVAMHEARRARREELDAARSANAAAREAVEREAREARRAVEALRAQRRRFEDARRVGVLTTATAADEEMRELDELRARRERVDARIDALLRDDERRGREARDDPAADAKAKTVDEFDDDDARELPRWKRRREARWAEEARRAAAALEARDPGETSDAAFARSSSVRRPFEDRTRASPSDVCARAARAVHADDRDALRAALLESEECGDAFLPSTGGDDGSNDALSSGISMAPSPGFIEGRRLWVVRARDEVGDTLLHLACALGRRRCAKLLLRGGADVNAKNANGVAPVDRAVENGEFDVADDLVRWAKKRGLKMGDEE